MPRTVRDIQRRPRASDYYVEIDSIKQQIISLWNSCSNPDQCANLMWVKARRVRFANRMGEYNGSFHRRVNSATGMRICGANLKRDGRPPGRDRIFSNQFTQLWNSRVIKVGVSHFVKRAIVMYVRELALDYKKFHRYYGYYAIER